MAEIRKTRPVSWVKAALNEFSSFPEAAQSVCLAAKKSTKGIQTPRREIDLLKNRLKSLKEMLK